MLWRDPTYRLTLAVGSLEELMVGAARVVENENEGRVTKELLITLWDFGRACLGLDEGQMTTASSVHDVLELGITQYRGYIWFSNNQAGSFEIDGLNG